MSNFPENVNAETNRALLSLSLKIDENDIWFHGFKTELVKELKKGPILGFSWFLISFYQYFLVFWFLPNQFHAQFPV